MSVDLLSRAVYLTGPTASGKTAVGVTLAEMIGAEVIALDSMTLYRRMDVGTAKPSLEERRGVPHHLLDVLDTHESASVADYRESAIRAAAAIESRGRRPLFVGGTPMYLKAMLRGLLEAPGANPELRDQLEKEADSHGNHVLHDRLRTLDPAAAARFPINDRRRVIRALELIAATGGPLAEIQKEHAQPAAAPHVFALGRPRDEIRDRISLRTRKMFQLGLIEEAQLIRQGPLSPVPLQAVGYREAFDLLDGRATLPQAIERATIRTHQLAKRQRTWFRGLAECQPFPIPDGEPPETTAQRLAESILEKI